jgi:hypothetical protein
MWLSEPLFRPTAVVSLPAEWCFAPTAGHVSGDVGGYGVGLIVEGSAILLDSFRIGIICPPGFLLTFSGWKKLKFLKTRLLEYLLC